MTKEERKIWQVQEIDGKGWQRTILSGQTRYIPARTRREAKEIYRQKYKKYKDTVTSANVVSQDMQEWETND